MGIEGFDRHEDLINQLKQNAHQHLKEKTEVHSAAIEILPETLLMYKHGADLYTPLKDAIEKAIADAPTAEIETLQQFVIRALEAELERLHAENPEMLRTYTTKLKHELEQK